VRPRAWAVGSDVCRCKSTGSCELSYVALESADRRIHHAMAPFLLETTVLRRRHPPNRARPHRFEKHGQPLQGLWGA
jgi:hypothetical protein